MKTRRAGKRVALVSRKRKLDQVVVDIEFLLISVIQGVALAALAENAAPLIANLQFEYWIYIVSAFLLVLIFWSQAIIHVLSFISWPLDLTHNFLYFLASLVEVMAFSQMTNPLKWFAFLFVFVLVSRVLYVFDLKLIQSREKALEMSVASKALYRDIVSQQQLELKVYVPLGLLFNLTAVLLIFMLPHVFIEQRFHILLASFQALLGVGILINSIRNFHKRSTLIAASMLLRS